MLGESFGSLFLALFSLLFVFIAILLMYVYIGRGKRGFLKKNKIREITRHYFNNKTFISLMEIEGVVYILGIGESGVTKLDKIDDSEVVNRLISDNGNTSNVDFKEILKRNTLISRYNNIKKTKRFEENKNEKSE
jgi:flagellar biogenesis protein FliO